MNDFANTELKNKLWNIFSQDIKQENKYYSLFLGDDFQYEALKNFLKEHSDTEIMELLFNNCDNDNFPKMIENEIIKPEVRKRLLII